MTDVHAVPTGFLEPPAPSDAAQRLYEADVADKPPWIAELPLASIDRITQQRRSSQEALRSVDEAIATLLDGFEEHRQLGDTLVVFTLIVGAWFVVAGIVRFVAAFASPEGRGGNLVTATLDVIAGIVILSWPDLGLSTLAVIIGIVLILRGVFFIVSGWQLHQLNDELPVSPTAHAPT